MTLDDTNFYVCGNCGKQMPHTAKGSFCRQCVRMEDDFEHLCKATAKIASYPSDTIESERQNRESIKALINVYLTKQFKNERK